MDGRRRRQLVALAALTVLPAMGCVRVSALGAPEILAGLSGIMLQPQDTCAAMRERFHVDYLPVVDNPAEIGLDYEETWVPVGEANIRVWYVPAELDRGTVVYSMGSAGTMACYLFSTDLLTSNGWSVVMYEYEGFGRSGGQASVAALQRDLEAVIAWTRARTGRDQVTLMGMSLGSIPSVAVAAEHPEWVNGVILDSPIALQALIERFGFLILGQSEELIERLNADLMPDAVIGRVAQPLLIFSHERDPIATPETSELLFELAAGPRELVYFPDVGHARGQFAATDSYLYYLETFLNDVWTPVAVAGQTAREPVAPLK